MEDSSNIYQPKFQETLHFGLNIPDIANMDIFHQERIISFLLHSIETGVSKYKPTEWTKIRKAYLP